MDNFKFMDPWPAWVRWLIVLPVAEFFHQLSVWTFVLIAKWATGGFALIVLVGSFFIYSVMFVWCAVATAPSLKPGVAFVLGGFLLFLAFFALRTPWAAIFGFPVVAGVLVAWALIVWGYLRQRQSGLLSR